ncbi:hypothetical protein KCP70_23710 [Salmonella enterica subsp. enterica]|nr:hypothetical protein KCP70_23710 [Salmonella enterica subsp. enterica]
MKKLAGSKPDFEPINFRNLPLTIVGIVLLRRRHRCCTTVISRVWCWA